MLSSSVNPEQIRFGEAAIILARQLFLQLKMYPPGRLR